GLHVLGVVKIVDAEQLFHVGDARFRQDGGPAFFVDGVVGFLLQMGNDLVDPVILVRRILGRAGDDQGRTGLVDQDRVHLVDNGVVKLPLHALGEVELHVVAQIVEAVLVVGAVGHVGAIGGLALLVV